MIELLQYIFLCLTCVWVIYLDPCLIMGLALHEKSIDQIHNRCKEAFYSFNIVCYVIPFF